ncbi:YdeI/OmpD-associated family protein [Aquimarina sp. 433]
MQYNTSVEEFISKKPEWVKSLQLLRSIMLTTEMEETIKWGVPTYTINGKNVVGLSAFKSYVGIWFHQGVFLKDPYSKLINAQEGKTKGLRQWRFSSFDDINKDQVLAYVLEAIQNQKEGKEITIERSSTEIEMPYHLKTELEQNKELKTSFSKLMPFKQKEYMEYISTAKRDATKDARLQKIIPMILKGIGLNDKYR